MAGIDVHTRPLVQPRGARLAFRVDVQAGSTPAAAVELGECLAKQGQAEPARAPGPAHADLVDPSMPVEYQLTRRRRSPPIEGEEP